MLNVLLRNEPGGLKENKPKILDAARHTCESVRGTMCNAEQEGHSTSDFHIKAVNNPSITHTVSAGVGRGRCEEIHIHMHTRTRKWPRSKTKVKSENEVATVYCNELIHSILSIINDTVALFVMYSLFFNGVRKYNISLWYVRVNEVWVKKW